MPMKTADISLGSVQHSFAKATPEDLKSKGSRKLSKRVRITKEDLNPKNIPNRARKMRQKHPVLGSVFLPAAFVSFGGGKSAVELNEFNFRAGVGFHIGFMPLFRTITANAGVHLIYDVRSRPDFFENKRNIRRASGFQPSLTLSYLEINFPLLDRISTADYPGDPEKTKGLGICAAIPLTYGLLSFCAESLNFFGKNKSEKKNWTLSARVGW